jgi:NAD(P)-dependent dehydrogenase (short-subunit alcohol dehydrogenase family)
LLEKKQTIDSVEKPIAFITAGASGIGKAIANRFTQQGFEVHVCDIDPVALEQTSAELSLASSSLCDVSQPEQLREWFSELTKQGGHLDVLVNNAGIAGPTAEAADISTEDWDKTIAVNLSGSFYASRLAIPLLKQSNNGSIINIASSAALFGFPLRSPYAAAKWGLIGLTKTLAMELGPLGIRVNAICPGSVNGPRLENVMESDAKKRSKTIDEIREIWTSQTSLRCFVDAEDIADMAAFLVSEQGRRISGQSLSVDGHTESLSSPYN